MRPHTICVLTIGLLLCAPFAGAAPEKTAPDTSSFAAPLEVGQDYLREALRKWYFPEGVIITDPAPEIVSRSDQGDHERWRVRYTVDIGERIDAWLLVPKPLPRPGQKLPLVLALHPTGTEGKDRAINNWPTPPKDAEQTYYRESRGYGLSLVRRGFVVFAPDRLAFGERNPEPGNTKYWEMIPRALQNLRERNPGWTIAGKAVWDLERALDFLVKLDFVDASRIGVIGHSLGAWDAILLSPVDERVKAIVMSHPGPLRYHSKAWREPQHLRYFVREDTLTRLGTEPAENIDYMLMAPRPQFVVWSISDNYDQPPGVLEAARVIGEYNRHLAAQEKGKFDFTLFLHGGGHDFSTEARAAAYAFLEQYLK